VKTGNHTQKYTSFCEFVKGENIFATYGILFGMKRIVIAGGGTGGHIYPSLSVVAKLREKLDGEIEIIYIGSGSSLEQPLRNASDRSYTISAGKMRRYFSLRNLFDPFITMWGFLQCLTILLREMPDAVFSKGGYAAFPVALAASIYRIPVVVHESDAIPGLANRILGKFAKKIALGFDSARFYFLANKVEVVGNMAQPGIREGSAHRARERWKFSESKPVILILGGSQGSQSVNRHSVDILEETLPVAQILHQTGTSHLEDVISAAKSREGVKPGRGGYVPVAFFSNEEMADALAVADLVVSRCGATTIAEIAACKKVSLLIPLASSANDHQRMNAYTLAKQDAAVVLEEANLTVNVFTGKLRKLLFDAELRDRLSRNIATFNHSDAADKVATMILEQAK
jgi:UDP-N-acetylglucosamine--N-acetylmuramyl-(pentapeptide) pyrophosphoryl-undecaprenol N-acetylglucosamine transferase